MDCRVRVGAGCGFAGRGGMVSLPDIADRNSAVVDPMRIAARD